MERVHQHLITGDRLRVILVPTQFEGVCTLVIIERSTADLRPHHRHHLSGSVESQPAIARLRRIQQ